MVADRLPVRVIVGHVYVHVRVVMLKNRQIFDMRSVSLLFLVGSIQRGFGLADYRMLFTRAIISSGPPDDCATRCAVLAELDATEDGG